MSEQVASKSKRTKFNFPYYTLRNISCPEDKAAKREVYFGQAPGESFLDLDNHRNVREYLTDAPSKKRNTPTQINKAIAFTLETNPDDFSFLNTGVTVVAHSVEIDDKGKKIALIEPSIINGAQTQGELKQYYTGKDNEGIPRDAVKVTFELIVTSDEDLINEISISRNFQNDVMALSIAGKRGLLKELDDRFQESHPGLFLAKKETDRDEIFIKTERVLQVITALMPAELWPIQKEKEKPNKVFTYSQKAKCLRMYTDIVTVAQDSSDPNHMVSKELYNFYLDIVGDAWTLYKKWKAHQGFRGTKLKCIKRNPNFSIKEVPDGIVFPIIASLSIFITKSKKGWKLNIPEAFDDKQIISSAKTALMEIADSNPNTMGKHRSCYSQLSQITSIYAQFLRV